MRIEGSCHLFRAYFFYEKNSGNREDLELSLLGFQVEREEEEGTIEGKYVWRVIVYSHILCILYKNDIREGYL